jgi:hypothetical protein
MALITAPPTTGSGVAHAVAMASYISQRADRKHFGVFGG